MVGCAALDITDSIVRAQQEERERIGQELHDNVNQILTTANLYLRLPEEEYYRSEDIRNKVSELTESAIEEIRQLSRGLVTPHFSEIGLIGHARPRSFTGICSRSFRSFRAAGLRPANIAVHHARR